MTKRYAVVAQVTISIHTYVEAKSEKAAKEIAEGRGMQGLEGRGNPEEEWCHSGELDGPAAGIESDGEAPDERDDWW